MEYRIEQSEQYLGNDYWNWSAWIEAPPELLRDIDRVVWILHPTFNPSRVESRSRETNFRLDSSGWGTFLLRAELHGPSGEPRSISHMLKLTYPDEREAAISKEALTPKVSDTAADALRPYVFISYSSEDAAQANVVREAMKNLGVRVRDAGEIKPGLPFDAAVRKLIRESAGVMSVVGSDYASPYVIAEMKLAESEEKPAIALLPKGVNRPLGLSPSIREMRFEDNSRKMESLLAGFVGTFISGRGR